MTLLQSKMAAAKVPFTPVPRMLELNENFVQSPPSNEVNSATSNADWEFPGPTEDNPDNTILERAFDQAPITSISPSWETGFS